MILFWRLFLLFFVGFQSGLAIFGGYDCPDDTAPYHVSLQKCDDNEENCINFCGASLLNEVWLMTTAKCALTFPIDTVKAVIGIKELSDISERRQESAVDRFIVHPEYVDIGDASPHDIALVKLKNTTQWTNYTQAGWVLPPGHGPYNTFGWIPGWGDTTGDDNTTEGGDNLQIMAIPFASLQDCMDRIAEVNPNNNITLSPDLHLCTIWLYDNETVSACSGDMGGSLMQNGFDLIGITSWAAHPCKIGAPTVYINANYYYDWIQDNIDDQ